MSGTHTESGSGEAAAPRRKSRPVYWVVSLVIAGVLLYLSVRGIDWSRVLEILSRARLAWVAGAIILMSVAVFLRAMRWRVLLSGEAPVTRGRAFRATCAGYFGNNFLPARAGELVRTVMISNNTSLSRTFVLTTAMSERVVDAIALILISSAVLISVPDKPAWLADASRTFAILGISGVVVIALLPRFERLGAKLIGMIPGPESLRSRLAHTNQHVLLGLRTFHSPGRLFRFVAYTVVIWCLDAITAVLVARALDLGVTMPQAFLLIAGMGLGSALPSTPGYVGIYQFVAVTVLPPFGYSKTDSIAYILLLQAAQYLMITFWGLAALGAGRGSGRDVRHSIATAGAPSPQVER